MSLLDALRQAEQQGKRTVHRSAEKVHKIETAIRRKIKACEAMPVSAYPDPEQERESAPNPKARTGIVSVNGRDVGEMRCTGGRRTG